MESGLLLEVTFFYYKPYPTSKQVPIPIYMKKEARGKGDVVVQISFQNDSEALKLLNLVSVHPLGAEFQPYIRFLPQQGMYVDMTESVGDKWLILLSEVFHSFLLEEKMLPVIEQIIISKFFYREREEIEAITEIASSIIEGERARCQGMLFSTEKN